MMIKYILESFEAGPDVNGNWTQLHLLTSIKLADVIMEHCLALTDMDTTDVRMGVPSQERDHIYETYTNKIGIRAINRMIRDYDATRMDREQIRKWCEGK